MLTQYVLPKLIMVIIIMPVTRASWFVLPIKYYLPERPHQEGREGWDLWRFWESRNAHRNLVGKPEGKTTWRPGRRWGKYYRKKVQGTGRHGAFWIHLALSTDKCWKWYWTILFHKMTSWWTSIFSRGTVLHRVTACDTQFQAVQAF